MDKEKLKKINHNEAERGRKKKIKEHISLIAHLLPQDGDNEKRSTLSVVERTAAYIEKLRRGRDTLLRQKGNPAQIQEMEELMRKREMLHNETSKMHSKIREYGIWQHTNRDFWPVRNISSSNNKDLITSAAETATASLPSRNINESGIRKKTSSRRENTVGAQLERARREKLLKARLEWQWKQQESQLCLAPQTLLDLSSPVVQQSGVGVESTQSLLEQAIAASGIPVDDDAAPPAYSLSLSATAQSSATTSCEPVSGVQTSVREPAAAVSLLPGVQLTVHARGDLLQPSVVVVPFRAGSLVGGGSTGTGTVLPAHKALVVGETTTGVVVVPTPAPIPNLTPAPSAPLPTHKTFVMPFRAGNLVGGGSAGTGAAADGVVLPAPFAPTQSTYRTLVVGESSEGMVLPTPTPTPATLLSTGPTPTPILMLPPSSSSAREGQTECMKSSAPTAPPPPQHPYPIACVLSNGEVLPLMSVAGSGSVPGANPSSTLQIVAPSSSCGRGMLTLPSQVQQLLQSHLLPTPAILYNDTARTEPQTTSPTTATITNASVVKGAATTSLSTTTISTAAHSNTAASVASPSIVTVSISSPTLTTPMKTAMTVCSCQSSRLTEVFSVTSATPKVTTAHKVISQVNSPPVVLNSTSLNGTSQNSTSLNGTSQNSTSLNGTSQNSAYLNGSPPTHTVSSTGGIQALNINAHSINSTAGNGGGRGGSPILLTLKKNNGQTINLLLDPQNLPVLQSQLQTPSIMAEPRNPTPRPILPKPVAKPVVNLVGGPVVMPSPAASVGLGEGSVAAPTPTPSSSVSLVRRQRKKESKKQGQRGRQLSKKQSGRKASASSPPVKTDTAVPKVAVPCSTVPKPVKEPDPPERRVSLTDEANPLLVSHDDDDDDKQDGSSNEVNTGSVLSAKQQQSKAMDSAVNIHHSSSSSSSPSSSLQPEKTNSHTLRPVEEDHSGSDRGSTDVVVLLQKENTVDQPDKVIGGDQLNMVIGDRSDMVINNQSGTVFGDQSDVVIGDQSGTVIGDFLPQRNHHQASPRSVSVSVSGPESSESCQERQDGEEEEEGSSRLKQFMTLLTREAAKPSFSTHTSLPSQSSVVPTSSSSFSNQSSVVPFPCPSSSSHQSSAVIPSLSSASLVSQSTTTMATATTAAPTERSLLDNINDLVEMDKKSREQSPGESYPPLRKRLPTGMKKMTTFNIADHEKQVGSSSGSSTIKVSSEKSRSIHGEVSSEMSRSDFGDAFSYPTVRQLSHPAVPHVCSLYDQSFSTRRNVPAKESTPTPFMSLPPHHTPPPPHSASSLISTSNTITTTTTTIPCQLPWSHLASPAPPTLATPPHSTWQGLPHLSTSASVVVTTAPSIMSSLLSPPAPHPPPVVGFSPMKTLDLDLYSSTDKFPQTLGSSLPASWSNVFPDLGKLNTVASSKPLPWKSPTQASMTVSCNDRSQSQQSGFSSSLMIPSLLSTTTYSSPIPSSCATIPSVPTLPSVATFSYPMETSSLSSSSSWLGTGNNRVKPMDTLSSDISLFPPTSHVMSKLSHQEKKAADSLCSDIGLFPQVSKLSHPEKPSVSKASSEDSNKACRPRPGIYSADNFVRSSSSQQSSSTRVDTAERVFPQQSSGGTRRIAGGSTMHDSSGFNFTKIGLNLTLPSPMVSAAEPGIKSSTCAPLSFSLPMPVPAQPSMTWSGTCTSYAQPPPAPPFSFLSSAKSSHRMSSYLEPPTPPLNMLMPDGGLNRTSMGGPKVSGAASSSSASSSLPSLSCPGVVSFGGMFSGESSLDKRSFNNELSKTNNKPGGFMHKMSDFDHHHHYHAPSSSDPCAIIGRSGAGSSQKVASSSSSEVIQPTSTISHQGLPQFSTQFGHHTATPAMSVGHHQNPVVSVPPSATYFHHPPASAFPHHPSTLNPPLHHHPAPPPPPIPLPDLDHFAPVVSAPAVVSESLLMTGPRFDPHHGTHGYPKDHHHHHHHHTRPLEHLSVFSSRKPSGGSQQQNFLGIEDGKSELSLSGGREASISTGDFSAVMVPPPNHPLLPLVPPSHHNPFTSSSTLNQPHHPPPPPPSSTSPSDHHHHHHHHHQRPRKRKYSPSSSSSSSVVAKKKIMAPYSVASSATDTATTNNFAHTNIFDPSHQTFTPAPIFTFQKNMASTQSERVTTTQSEGQFLVDSLFSSAQALSNSDNKKSSSVVVGAAAADLGPPPAAAYHHPMFPPAPPPPPSSHPAQNSGLRGINFHQPGFGMAVGSNLNNNGSGGGNPMCTPVSVTPHVNNFSLGNLFSSSSSSTAVADVTMGVGVGLGGDPSDRGGIPLGDPGSGRGGIQHHHHPHHHQQHSVGDGGDQSTTTTTSAPPLITTLTGTLPTTI